MYAVPTFSKSLESLEQVVEAGKQGKVIPLLNYQNSMDAMFKASPWTTLQHVANACNTAQ